MKLPDVRMNLIDRAVAVFAPEAGVARMRARAQMAVAGAWAGGSTTRLPTAGWLPYGGSADVDMLVDRRFLRNRSRDMQRNNPLARGAINTVVTSTVSTGLVLRATVDAEALELEEEEAQEWQRTTEREFRLWAESPRACDAEAACDFYGLQSLAFRSCLESGDVFAVLPMVKRMGSLYDVKVQLIEADRVTNADMSPDTEGHFGGIKRDKYGAPVEYQILRKHPGGLMSPSSWEWDTVPAYGARSGRRNVVHLFDKLRPGQPRGVPYLAPVIEMLKQLSDYTDGELRAALVSSMFTVFVKSESGFGLGPDSTGAGATTQQVTGDAMKLGAGAIVDLSPGEDVSFANPNRPSTNFDPFVQAMLRQVGAALELPFEVLIKHYTASYSAARASMLEAWRFFNGRRSWLASNFCQPIYEAWLDEAVARGRVQAPGYFTDPAVRAAYLRAEWVGDSPGQLDPQKEVDAAVTRLENNLTTYADETTALTGRDWHDVIARRGQEEKALKAAGLQAPPPPGLFAKPGKAPDPNAVPGAPSAPADPTAEPDGDETPEIE